jgi:hypothetical protein
MLGRAQDAPLTGRLYRFDPRPREGGDAVLVPVRSAASCFNPRLREGATESFLYCGVVASMRCFGAGGKRMQLCEELSFLANCNTFRPGDPETKGIRPINADFRSSAVYIDFDLAMLFY